MGLGTLGTGQACKAEPFREGDKEEEEREKGGETLLEDAVQSEAWLSDKGNLHDVRRLNSGHGDGLYPAL